MALLILAILFWFIALARKRGFWPVLGYWTVMMVVGTCGMAAGGFL